MPLACRHESSADRAAIHGVVTAAFGQPDEARLVEALRRGGGLVLSAVAELGVEIIGHIAYSPVTIVGAQGNLSGLALAPMAVHPAKQRKGIGSALIRCPFETPREAFMMLELRPGVLRGRSGITRNAPNLRSFELC